MSFFDLALPLSVLLTVGLAVVLRRRSVLAVAGIGFAATNALALVGLIWAEALWNPRPDYAWRFDSRYLDGAFRGFGAFLFYTPALQSRIIVGVGLVSTMFAGIQVVVKCPPASQATKRQYSIETARQLSIFVRSLRGSLRRSCLFTRVVNLSLSAGPTAPPASG
jgi:hypothetical protein